MDFEYCCRHCQWWELGYISIHWWILSKSSAKRCKFLKVTEIGYRWANKWNIEEVLFDGSLQHQQSGTGLPPRSRTAIQGLFTELRGCTFHCLTCCNCSIFHTVIGNKVFFRFSDSDFRVCYFHHLLLHNNPDNETNLWVKRSWGGHLEDFGSWSSCQEKIIKTRLSLTSRCQWPWTWVELFE